MEKDESNVGLKQQWQFVSAQDRKGKGGKVQFSANNASSLWWNPACSRQTCPQIKEEGPPAPNTPSQRPIPREDVTSSAKYPAQFSRLQNLVTKRVVVSPTPALFFYLIAKSYLQVYIYLQPP